MLQMSGCSSSGRFFGSSAENDPSQTTQTKQMYDKNLTNSPRNVGGLEEFYTVNEMTIKGHSCPKPNLTVAETNFPEHIRSVLELQNWMQLTPIQAQGWPVALSGRDLVCIAQTGSGQTLSYIIPAILHISQQPMCARGYGPTCVVLVPTSELAEEVAAVASLFGTTSNIQITCVDGCVAEGPEIPNLARGAAICIATPGRLLEFLAESGANLRSCTYVVLDGADRMLDKGFEPLIRQIIDQVAPDRQTLMYSSTWPEEVQSMTELLLGDYLLIQIGAMQIPGVDDRLPTNDVLGLEDIENRMSETRGVEFEVGQQFSSFAELENTLSTYSKENFIQLWKRDCKTKESAMKRCPKRAELIANSVKYYQLEYCCIHGGRKFTKRGNGQRHTSTFKKACPFSMKFNASQDGQRLVLTAFVNRHENHELSEDLFKHLPHQRRLQPADEKRASSLLDMQANKQLVQMKLTQETGKIITLRDLSNIASKGKSGVSRNNVENFVTTLRDKYSRSPDVKVYYCGKNNGNEYCYGSLSNYFLGVTV